MKIIYRDKLYSCSFELALDMFSGKWKGLILWNLSKGTMRYSELKRASGNITQKMLTQTLRELEKNGLVTRKVYPVIPPKVEYSITDNAKKLIPVLKSIQEWGDYMIENNECKIIN